MYIEAAEYHEGEVGWLMSEILAPTYPGESCITFWHHM